MSVDGAATGCQRQGLGCQRQGLDDTHVSQRTSVFLREPRGGFCARRTAVVPTPASPLTPRGGRPRQIITVWLEGSILGTLLHYLVDKDPVNQVARSLPAALRGRSLLPPGDGPGDGRGTHRRHLRTRSARSPVCCPILSRSAAPVAVRCAGGGPPPPPPGFRPTRVRPGFVRCAPLRRASSQTLSAQMESEPTPCAYGSVLWVRLVRLPPTARRASQYSNRSPPLSMYGPYAATSGPEAPVRRHASQLLMYGH